MPENLTGEYEIRLYELDIRKTPRTGTFIFIFSRPSLNIQGHNDIKNSGPCSI